MKEAQHTQTPDETDQPIRFVPGHVFFCRSLVLPQELADGEELTSFAELSLEALSPFPLEQLAWGTVLDREAGQLFLYAACRPRLPANELEGWEKATHVFPAFLPLVLDKPEGPALRALVDASSLTVCYFDGQGRFPAQVVSAALPEDADDEIIAALRERLSVRVRKVPQTESLPTMRLESAQEQGTSLSMTLVSLDEVLTEVRKLEGEEALWAADVREADFIAAERRRRVASQRVGYALAGVGIAAVLLLFLVLITSIGDWLVSRRETLVTQQDNAVFAVQQSSDFLVQLEQFSEIPFQPFNVLGAANQVLQERQPRKIKFSSAALSSNNELSIQGEADNVEEVNLYSERLRESTLFDKVNMADVRTRGGKVNFSLNLRFIPEGLERLITEAEAQTVEVEETQDAEFTESTPEKEASDASN